MRGDSLLPLACALPFSAWQRQRLMQHGRLWLLHLPSTALQLAAFIWLGATLLAAPAAYAAPSFTEVKQAATSSESLLLDRNGEVIHRLRSNPQERRGQWVTLADISPALRTAMVLSEDKRFYEHSGIDWRAVGAAAWGNLWNEKTRGASTITMQLVGLIHAEPRSPGRRTMLQKFGQAASARMLDARWKKSEILEAYLNLVPFRGEIVGIDALSRTLFGKAAHGLNAREAAITAALVRAPNAPHQTVAQRACGILASMQNVPRSPALCDSLSLFAAGVMQRKAWSPNEGLAPHLARKLLGKQNNGATVRSTLSAPLQRYAAQQLQQTMHELSGRNVGDGAVLVLDNATGDVLAWVGAAASTSTAPEVDFVTAPRQPGSTLKPFLYAQAIAEKRLTAASLIDDSAAAIPTQSGLYVPKDYDRQFRGWVSVRQALAASLNVPAVRAIGIVGVNRFAEQLRRLGIQLTHTGDYYGYSLALGSAEMNLLQLTNAYRTLANAGRYSAVRMQATDPVSDPIKNGKQALDERANFIISHILSDNNARLTTFGNNSILHTRFWTAVKTGTSKDMRDNWAIGYSQRYTVGVWVGNARGQSMWNVSGTSGAAPVWAAVMRYLHADTPSSPPSPPPGLVQTHVTFAPPAAAQAASTQGKRAQHAAYTEPARMEWFISGTEQDSFARSEKPVRTVAARINSPVDGTLLAIDPDIPPRNQRVLLRTSIANGRWHIDGKYIGQGAALAWMPWPGKHQITLHAPGGQILDQIGIEVRGAAALSAPQSAHTDHPTRKHKTGKNAKRI